MDEKKRPLPAQPAKLREPMFRVEERETRPPPQPLRHLLDDDDGARLRPTRPAAPVARPAVPLADRPTNQRQPEQRLTRPYIAESHTDAAPTPHRPQLDAPRRQDRFSESALPPAQPYRSPSAPLHFPIEFDDPQMGRSIGLIVVSLLILWAFWGGDAIGVLSNIVAPSQAPEQAVAEALPADPGVVPRDPNDLTLTGPPSISAQQIDSVLASYGSPAAGTGQIFYNLGVEYGIDPAFALAFFIHESTAGTAPGWAGWKPDGSNTHNIGNIICAGYATCHGRFRDYPGWEEGIRDWYRLIAVEYINGRGLTTVDQVIPVYAPSFENDVNGYIGVIQSLVGGWRSGQVAR